jgi:protein O-mannosyl-transferase
MPALGLLILALPLVLAHRLGERAFRLTVFGVGFFVAMLVLVLQFVSVSATVMADRYSYLSYVGPLLLIATVADRLLEHRRFRVAMVATLALYSLALGVSASRRARVWTNSETLWSDVIEKYPFRFAQEEGGRQRVLERGATTAYQNRGNYYRDHGRSDAAIRDYDVLVAARVSEPGPYINLANVYGERGEELVRQRRPDEAYVEFARALEMYSRAIELGGDLFESHLNRGITYASMQQHERALEDFRTALAFRPGARDVLSNVAHEELQLKRYDECIADASTLIEADPADANAYFFRGTSLMNSGRPAEALADLRRAVAVNQGFGSAWFNLSVVYRQGGDLANALDAARRAKESGYPVPDAYLQQLTQ